MIAIDGKALRRFLKATSNRSPLHVVNAVAAGVCLALRRVRADGKSNEIEAMQALPGLLDIVDGTVTAAATCTRWATAGKFTKKGGNFVLVPTGSQEMLHDDVPLHMADPESVGQMLRCNAVNKGHGRIKIRFATVCHDATRRREPASLVDPSCHRKGHSDSGDRKGGRSKESRCFLLSERLGTERFLKMLSSHLAVENSLHWPLDVTMALDVKYIRSCRWPSSGRTTVPKTWR